MYPILLLINSPTIRHIYATLLTTSSYQVYAGTLLEAPVFLQKVTPAVVILDLEPHQECIRFLQHLRRSLGPSTFILVISIHAHPTSNRLFCSAGASAWYPKPLYVKPLLSVVHWAFTLQGRSTVHITGHKHLTERG